MSDPLQHFLRRHAPEPPPPAADLEERILAAAAAPPPAVEDFLRRHAPEPPPPAADLEERILAALRTPAPRRVRRWPPLVAAAGIALLLIGGLGLWQNDGPSNEPALEALIPDSKDAPAPLFAVDPETDLYDVQF